MKKIIDLIAAARPNFMKIAPIIDAIHELQNNGKNLSYRLIHTGQHYDRSMSGSFFEQLNIPVPYINLEVGSGTQAEQTASIMTRYEKVLLDVKSDVCVVVGDVTSTMAASITSQKLGIPVAHIEGGIRSGDWTMPEEINRLITDSITNWFFTTSEQANQNLEKSGVSEDRIFFVGNTMIDTLIKNRDKLIKPQIWENVKLNNRSYFVLTLHRPANVDDENNLIHTIKTIVENSRGLPIIFPVHPRTRKQLNGMNTFPNLYTVDPMGYLEFNYLVKNAKAVITDSGGITEESTVFGIPCMTLRDNTERPETITLGTNELIGTNPANLPVYFEKLFSNQWKKGSIPPLWDGKSAQRIVAILQDILQ